MVQGCCILCLIKQNCLLKFLLGSLIVFTLISSLAFPVTLTMFKSVMTNNTDSSKAPGLDCIPVVVLMNCELDHSEILAVFSMCLKESCFSYCMKVASASVSKNVEKRSVTKIH